MSLNRRPGMAELVRRGVIDPRKLPHPLRKEVADDIRRRIEELHAERERRRDEPIPF